MHRQSEHRPRTPLVIRQSEKDAPEKEQTNLKEPKTDSKKPVEVDFIFDEKNEKRKDTMALDANEMSKSDNGLPSGGFKEKGQDSSPLTNTDLEEQELEPEDSITKPVMSCSASEMEEAKKKVPVEHNELPPIEHEDFSPVTSEPADTKQVDGPLSGEHKDNFVSRDDHDTLCGEQKIATKDGLKGEISAKHFHTPLPGTANGVVHDDHDEVSEPLVPKPEVTSPDPGRVPCENDETPLLSPVTKSNVGTVSSEEAGGSEQPHLVDDDAITPSEEVNCDSQSEAAKLEEVSCFHLSVPKSSSDENDAQTKTAKPQEQSHTPDNGLQQGPRSLANDVEQGGKPQLSNSISVQAEEEKPYSQQPQKSRSFEKPVEQKLKAFPEVAEVRKFSASPAKTCLTLSPATASQNAQLPEGDVLAGERTVNASTSEEISSSGEICNVLETTVASAAATQAEEMSHSCPIQAEETAKNEDKPEAPSAAQNPGQNELHVPLERKSPGQYKPKRTVEAQASGEDEPEAAQTYDRHDSESPVAAQTSGKNKPSAAESTPENGSIPGKSLGQNSPDDTAGKLEQTNLGTHGQNRPVSPVATSERKGIPAQGVHQAYPDPSTVHGNHPIPTPGRMKHVQSPVQAVAIPQQGGTVEGQGAGRDGDTQPQAQHAGLEEADDTCAASFSQDASDPSKVSAAPHPRQETETLHVSLSYVAEDEVNPLCHTTPSAQLRGGGCVAKRVNPSSTQPGTQDDVTEIPHPKQEDFAQERNARAEVRSRRSDDHDITNELAHPTQETHLPPETAIASRGSPRSTQSAKQEGAVEIRRPSAVAIPRITDEPSPETNAQAEVNINNTKPCNQNLFAEIPKSTQPTNSSRKPGIQSEVRPSSRQPYEHHEHSPRASPQDQDSRSPGAASHQFQVTRPTSRQPREHDEDIPEAPPQHPGTQTPSTAQRRTQIGVHLRHPYQEIGPGCLVPWTPPEARRPSAYARGARAVVDLRGNFVDFRNPRDAHRQRGPGRHIRGVADLHILQRTEQGGREYVHHPSSEDNLWRIVLACFRSTTPAPEEGELCVCHERRPDTVLFNCRQHLVCLECATYSDACPICEAPIRAYMQIY